MSNEFNLVKELRYLAAKLSQSEPQYLPFDSQIETLTNWLSELHNEPIEDAEPQYWLWREKYTALLKSRRERKDEAMQELERLQKAVEQAYDAEQNELSDLNKLFWESPAKGFLEA